VLQGPAAEDSIKDNVVVCGLGGALEAGVFLEEEIPQEDQNHLHLTYMG
jgi:hypothetical protein